ncbi:Ig-like domain-containing protein [Algibacter sp. PT7-4]|uniref:Ig-like domain-containing protein n=1 Tax=Algibacter ulvanivorans TaxID=3400999 RepID=UPI003AAB288E
MKNLRLNLRTLTILLLFLMLLPSCNNEEIFVAESTIIADETDEENEEENEDTDNEDVAPPIETIDDEFTTSENLSVDIELHINDINIPESVELSNTNPSNGTLLVNDNDTPNNILDDTIIYTPNPNFSGVDSFEYTICDALNTDNCDTALVTITVEANPDDIATELKAFPTAYGFASKATGGRGGVVLHVTNLNDSGPGSFREACETVGPKTIVFDVSGTITLLSPLANERDCTIAGQTAPSGGITIRGQRLKARENTIIRYIRFRQDREDGSMSMSGIAAWSQDDLILDHCSISYGRDESILFWDGGTKAGAHTIQKCIVAEGKTGVILGSGVSDDRRGNAGQYSFHQNLIEHMHRTPNTAGDGDFELVNNVIYNWQIRLSSVYNSGRINHINNYYKAGSASEAAPPNINGHYFNKIGGVNGSGFDSKVYTEGNIYEGFTAANEDNWNAWYYFSSNQLADESRFRANSPYSFSQEFPLSPDNANEAFQNVLADVGANASLNADGSVTKWLDSNDTLYISDALNGEDSFSVRDGSNGITPRWYAAEPYLSLNFPVIPENTRPAGYDTDRDGMADEWERRTYGDLSKTGKDDTDGDGYTDLEEFLNLVDN